MSSGGHSDGVKKNQFCALRKSGKCDCGNDYQKNCTGWSFAFIQGTQMKVSKVHEAHHVLCVASVTEFIGIKPEIEPIVKQTQWCINAKPNMLAMPLWGQTIKYYCNIQAVGAAADPTKALQAVGAPPPFQNIPMHDYDHNSKKGYKKFDVDAALKKLADQIEKNQDKHKAAVGELRGRLNSLSNSMKSLLDQRGTTRCGGTHAAWQKGLAQPTSNWYLPFSMAATPNAEKRTFPTSGEWGKLANKILALVRAFGKWGP